jgi:phospholipid/cholesterol/gamma-HCH transport system substrate-binding protein
MRILDGVNTRVIAFGVAIVLMAATFFTFHAQPDTTTATAHFSRAVSIYKGSEVRVLGVPIGSVTAVVPEGNSVRVDMKWDSKYKVPSNAKAVIITPTLVADRYVQLTPAYNSGKVMKSGADIPVQDTGTPVELDRIYASLKTLSNALGPNGANRHGALSDLLHSGAKTLHGEGARGNQMINDLSRASQTFGRGSGQLFDTVTQLSQFSTVLANNDDVVQSFIENLAGVSGELSGERRELRQLLAALAHAVGTVKSFVHNNRNAVSRDLKSLTDVVGVVAKQRDSLAEALEKGPLGAGNLALAYDNPTASIGGRFAIGGNFDDADGSLCAIVQADSTIPKLEQKVACKIFTAVLGNLPKCEVPPGQDCGASSEGTPSLPSESSVPSAPKLGGGKPAGSLGDLLGGGR